MDMLTAILMALTSASIGVAIGLWMMIRTIDKKIEEEHLAAMEKYLNIKE